MLDQFACKPDSGAMLPCDPVAFDQKTCSLQETFRASHIDHCAHERVMPKPMTRPTQTWERQLPVFCEGTQSTISQPTSWVLVQSQYFQLCAIESEVASILAPFTKGKKAQATFTSRSANPAMGYLATSPFLEATQRPSAGRWLELTVNTQ